MAPKPFTKLCSQGETTVIQSAIPSLTPLPQAYPSWAAPVPQHNGGKVNDLFPTTQLVLCHYAFLGLLASN